MPFSRNCSRRISLTRRWPIFFIANEPLDNEAIGTLGRLREEAIFQAS
jgi:hypothetical protein